MDTDTRIKRRKEIRQRLIKLKCSVKPRTPTTIKPRVSVSSMTVLKEETPYKYIFTTRLPPGDIVTLTAAIRDLKLAYPEYQINTATRHPDIWKFNPHIDNKINASNAKSLAVHYPTIHASNTNNLPFISGYRLYIEEKLGIKIPQTSSYPDLHFSRKELDSPPIDKKYWVVFAGGKKDFQNKWWATEHYQEVVNNLKDKIHFVQVGRAGDFHTPLNHVTNLIGKTSFRQLMVLIRHSQGVLCPITCGMHLAAGCDKPCVVIAGGREPISWAKYPSHTYLHTIGQLACCKNGGCFKTKVGSPGVKSCKHFVVTNQIKEAKCMNAITPDIVTDSILNYKPRAVSVLSPETALKSSFTIGVLLYGDHTKLHRRVITDILDKTPKVDAIRVGCNAVCKETLNWLKTIPQLTLYIEKENLGKYPLMKKMLQNITSEWFVWFDDDTQIVSSDWLKNLQNKIASHSDIVAFGKEFYIKLSPSQVKWIKSRYWYKEKPILTKNGKPISRFYSGAWWCIKTSILSLLNWPDSELHHCGGDVMLGAALYQNGFKLYNYSAGIQINHKEPRRGINEKPVGA
jgi:ADP-heptose:LPS heptosyltransferase